MTRKEKENHSERLTKKYDYDYAGTFWTVTESLGIVPLFLDVLWTAANQITNRSEIKSRISAMTVTHIFLNVKTSNNTKKKKKR